MKLNLPETDAFLMVSESMHNADMYYATGFLAIDSFVYLNSNKEKLIVSDMELGRAEKESRIRDVVPTSRYGIMEKLRKFKDIDAAYCEMIIELLRSEEVKRIAVPYDFPVHPADCMRNDGFEVIPVRSPFREMREVKKEYEILAIEKAQRAGEKALGDAIRAIKNAPIKNVVLWQKDAPDIIIACGKGSSDPHWLGEGELLADEPIVMDMVPRSKKERYYSDMTRTVMRGTPSEELKEMYSAVLDAQVLAISKIKAGVTGSEIHSIVCDVLEERGYETARGKTGVFTEGFIHSTGHGVGLDVHEAPSLSENGKELKAGCVVTVEPGLYFKNIGGIRLEDVVVVMRNGCKNLTMFEKNLVLK
ncbi:MAG: Xaa-Pro peptidase family protein [Candidatus Methanoperedens sp.]|nr:Xaa-Pro peptidase family protein [Candidatus Methanoperedens sp.]